MAKSLDAKAPINFNKLSEELDQILEELQSENLDIDQALANYERGQAIIKLLEDYVKKAQNSVKVIGSKTKEAK